MYSLSPRRLLTRAGTGAAAIALVGLAGYSVGQSQSPQASAIAASSPSISAPVVQPDTGRIVRERRERRRPRRRHSSRGEARIHGADADAAAP